MSTTPSGSGTSNGFVRVILGPGFEEATLLTLGSVRTSDYDDGYLAGHRVRAELLQDALARYIGKVQVEEDQIRAMLPGDVNSQSALHRREQT